MASDNTTMGGFFSKSELAGKGVVQISRNRRDSFTGNLILLVSNFEGPNVSVINRKCSYEMGVLCGCPGLNLSTLNGQIYYLSWCSSEVYPRWKTETVLSRVGK